MEDGYVVVGSYRNDTGAANAGQAYVYNAQTGEHVVTLNNPTPVANDLFGLSINVQDDLVIVGGYAVSQTGGEVHLFRASTGELLHSISDPSGDSDTGFGVEVVMEGSSLGIGAHLQAAGGTDAGAAYFYDIGPFALELSQFVCSGKQGWCDRRDSFGRRCPGK